METTSAAWVSRPHPRPEARLRLFCFPFAGGSSSTYVLWGTRLPGAVEVCPVQLPGRDARASEAPIGSLVRLAVATATEIASLVDKPYALFGHGMGALVAFEVARALRRAQRPLPVALLVSGCHAPQNGRVGSAAIERADLNSAERAREAGALPDEILRDPERLAQCLPVLRADLEAVADYTYSAERPFDFPITAFRAKDAGDLTEAHSQQWQAETTAPFEQLTLPGGRFYIHSRPDPLLAHLGSRLRRLLAVPPNDR